MNTIKLLTIIAFVVLSISASSFGEENDHRPNYLTNDPRQPLDRVQHPEYNAIGIIRSDLGRGSAWLGNECLVWTAKHIIGANKNIIGKKVKFEVAQSPTPDKAFEYSVEGEVVASGNPEGKQFDEGAEDWALIKLKSSVGKKVGYIAAAQYSVEDATTCTTLEVAGFPGEKDLKQLWYQTNCPLQREFSGITAFNLKCPVTRGNSGGPVLCRETDNSLLAIGIIIQRERDDSGGLAANFTYDWKNAKPAFQKFMNTCE